MVPETSAAAVPAGSSRRLATAAVLLALVVAALEATVVTSVMPTIAADLGGLDIYAWVFSAFLLASMLGILVCGKLADALGRRPVFVAGMGLFLVGSVLCGAAQSIEQLIAFRVLQGLGAGAIQPIAMTLSADLYTLRERARVQALFTTAWGAASGLGPLIGGLLVLHASWRWAFVINVPIGVLTVVVLLASYRDPPRRQQAPLGITGAVLAGVSAALALLALEPASARLGPLARLAPAALSVAALTALVRVERRSDVPILPASLLPDPVVRAGVAASMLAGGLLYACTAYVPLWLARQMHQDALTSGAALVPLLVGWAVGSSFGVHVLVRWGMRTSVGGGFAITAAGAAALCAAALQGLAPAYAFAALALLGLGLGPASSTALVATQSHVAWRWRGTITSTLYATRMLGGSIAVAALGSGGAGGTPGWRFAGIAALAIAAPLVIGQLAPAHVTEADVEPA